MMFATRAGSVDRVLRAIVGVALLAGFAFNQGQVFRHYAMRTGIIPLATGIVGTCAVYPPLGMPTCPMHTS